MRIIFAEKKFSNRPPYCLYGSFPCQTLEFFRIFVAIIILQCLNSFFDLFLNIMIILCFLHTICESCAISIFLHYRTLLNNGHTALSDILRKG